jgi:GntR family transcriptional regulator
MVSVAAASKSRITGPGPVLPDRSSPVPLWAQVSEDIRRRVNAGAFDDGFPGEIALTEEYEVSRHTIREALRILRSEGILRSERGRGTTVEQGSYSQNLGTLYSLYRTIEDQGVAQRSEVRRLGTTTNPSVAANLQLPASTELVVLERVRFADDEPLAFGTAWLPKDVASPILKADFTRSGLYDTLAAKCGVRPDTGSERVSAQNAPKHVADMLAAKCGIRPDTGSERVSAQNAPKHVAEMLGLPTDAAVLYIERVAFAGDIPVEWRETYIRGDRFSFEAEWSPGNSSITPIAETNHSQ